MHGVSAMFMLYIGAHFFKDRTISQGELADID